jgi:hypothetical protein
LLTDTQKENNTFLVYDKLGHNLFLVIPGQIALVYTSNEKLRYKSWSSLSSFDYTCGCTSLLGRVFLVKGTKIFQYGNSVFGEKYYADREADRDATWVTNTAFTAGEIVWDAVGEESYTCLVSHVSSINTFAVDRADFPHYWLIYDGVAITFDLEMPWFDGKDPMKVKQLRFVSIGTRGTATFTLQMFVDNLYKDYDGNVIYDAARTMDFVGNDAPYFGSDPDTAPYGGGRRSRDPRLFSFNAKFKTAKFRITGSSREPLEVINFSFLFARGRFTR